MTGRPAKSLLEHVQDRSFRAREHEQLLETSALLHSKELRKIQGRYQRAKRADTKYRLAQEFERALQPTVVDGGQADVVDDEGPPLEAILDELGPPHSAERVINFFPRFLKHFRGPKAGQPFELEDWQQAFIREAFKMKRGRRVYKIIYLIVPGGCGKSPLVAGLSLYALCEFTDAPELYCLAGIKRQAGKVQQFAQGFVKRGELRRFLRIRGRRIVRKDTDGEMEVLASSGANLEGDSPTMLSIDELQAFKDKRQEESFVALVGKLHKRPEACGFVISTAGRGEDNFLRRKIKEILASATAKITRRGYLTIARDEENGVLLWMYAAPAKAPLKGKKGLEVLRRVTPASWVDPHDVMKLLALVGETEFRRLARNEWVTSKNQWMQPGLWDRCRHKTRYWTPRTPQRGWPPQDTEVILGFDGSYNNDATALVGCTRDRHLFVVDVWERPEDDPDWTVPRDLVDQAVDEAMARWKVLRFAADPPGWRDEIEAWAERYDDVFTTMFSTNQIKLMAEACREFYSDVSTKKSTHDGHPALARHLANAYTRESADGAYIVKERRDSPNKIDAAVAAVIARYLAVREKPKKKAKLVSW